MIILIMDFLRVDQKIPGQNYCCMSFVSPLEDMFEKKETFCFNKFLKSAAEKYNISFHEIFRDYQDFKKNYADKLQEDFNRLVNNKTNIRGVKFRGSFDTLEEAQEQAKRLREGDKNFHVWVGQVGYWLPFDPDPDMVKDSRYIEDELNTLVKGYEENQIMAQKYFEDRKRNMMEKAVKEGREIKQEEVDKPFDIIDISSNVHPIEIIGNDDIKN